MRSEGPGGARWGPRGVRGALSGVEVPPESGFSAPRPQERKCGWKVVLQRGTRGEQVWDGKDNYSPDIFPIALNHSRGATAIKSPF